MTFTNEPEIAEFEAICARLGYSRSDALRHAVNVAYKLQWDVPLWRKRGETITNSGHSKRKTRRNTQKHDQ